MAKQAKEKPPEKFPKSQVDYRVGGDHCGACAYWIEASENEQTETGLCQKVAGEIEEDFWCTLFSRKNATLAQGFDDGGM